MTIIEDVRPAGDFAKPLLQLAAERNWTRVGALDLDQFPYDINKAIRSGSLEVVNVESGAVSIRMAMHRNSQSDGKRRRSLKRF